MTTKKKYQTICEEINKRFADQVRKEVDIPYVKYLSKTGEFLTLPFFVNEGSGVTYKLFGLYASVIYNRLMDTIANVYAERLHEAITEFETEHEGEYSKEFFKALYRCNCITNHRANLEFDLIGNTMIYMDEQYTISRSDLVMYPNAILDALMKIAIANAKCLATNEPILAVSDMPYITSDTFIQLEQLYNKNALLTMSRVLYISDYDTDTQLIRSILKMVFGEEIGAKVIERFVDIYENDDHENGDLKYTSFTSSDFMSCIGAESLADYVKQHGNAIAVNANRLITMSILSAFQITGIDKDEILGLIDSFACSSMLNVDKDDPTNTEYIITYSNLAGGNKFAATMSYTAEDIINYAVGMLGIYQTIHGVSGGTGKNFTKTWYYDLIGKSVWIKNFGKRIMNMVYDMSGMIIEYRMNPPIKKEQEEPKTKKAAKKTKAKKPAAKKKSEKK